MYLFFGFKKLRCIKATEGYVQHRIYVIFLLGSELVTSKRAAGNPE